MIRTSFVVAALLLFSSGCVPTLHFRSATTPYDPLPPNCALVDRCDYPDARTQARCEMTELHVPETGALVECTELGVEG